MMVVLSVAVSIVAAECVVRFINGQPQFVFPLTIRSAAPR